MSEWLTEELSESFTEKRNDSRTDPFHWLTDWSAGFLHGDAEGVWPCRRSWRVRGDVRTHVPRQGSEARCGGTQLSARRVRAQQWHEACCWNSRAGTYVYRSRPTIGYGWGGLRRGYDKKNSSSLAGNIIRKSTQSGTIALTLILWFRCTHVEVMKLLT